MLQNIGQFVDSEKNLMLKKYTYLHNLLILRVRFGIPEYGNLILYELQQNSISFKNVITDYKLLIPIKY